MKYRHSYHAGNFADTMKHIVVLELLRALLRKPGAFIYVETHAGRGAYPLSGREMRATAEYREGIGRLLERRDTQQGAIRDYVELVLRLGSGAQSDRLARYPGSPLLAAQFLRREDRAVLFETEPSERRALERLLGSYRNVHVHGEDGYDALRAVLPPRERRGMVLIDPPYEDSQQEFSRVLEALLESYRRWATGIYAIWYPVKERSDVGHFHRRLVESGVRKILVAELGLFPDDSRVALNGSGMIVVNPPWKLDENLRAQLPALHKALEGHTNSGVRCDWLVPE
jgi:23S rRNA (adenine2030-N6)-methyltransferase